MPYTPPDRPVVQLALDFLNLAQAQRVAVEAASAGPMWIEAGTPLIKAEGLESVRSLRAAFPQAVIVADMKAMDAGRVEVESAKKAGADVMTVCAAATDATVRDCVEHGRHLGCAICADLVGVADPAGRARQLEALGVDLVSVHTPIDRQMEGASGFDTLAAVAQAVAIPVCCAGGVTAETAARAAGAGARVVIVGGAITKAPDARAAAADILRALATGSVVAAGKQRVGRDRVREVLLRVSTPNLSDAMHRGGALRGLENRNPGVRLCGPAFTVQCAPGDWSKPVQAIDQAQPGDVLVIDAGDDYPAVWGGLASRTAKRRGLGGVVIRGACRDLTDIRAVGLPLWSSKTSPDAGEARGMGVTGIPLRIGGLAVHPGDWLAGDDDGLVLIPAAQVVDVANRGADIMEREERLAAEIDRGRTLAEVAELKKWEQR